MRNYHRVVNWGRAWELLYNAGTWAMLVAFLVLLLVAIYTPEIVEAMQ